MDNGDITQEATDTSAIVGKDNSNPGDSIYDGIQKLEAQIDGGVVPPGSIDGGGLKVGTITLGKLALSTDRYNPNLPLTAQGNSKTPSDGDTLKIAKDGNGDNYWSYASVTGINHKGPWDVVANDDFLANIVDPSNGDYYILTTAGQDSDTNSWTKGDWAIYSESTSSWNRIPAAGAFQSFNGRPGAVVPAAGDYTFEMLDFTGATLDLFSDVDITTNAPSGDNIVLKHNGTNWVPGSDVTGLSGKIYTDNITDGTITSDNFDNSVSDQFLKSDFNGTLQAKIDEHYKSGGNALLQSNLDFGGNALKNCSEINDIDYIQLHTDCSGINELTYQAKLPDPALINNNSVQETNKMYFLNETGVFSRINISDLPLDQTTQNMMLMRS